MKLISRTFLKSPISCIKKIYTICTLIILLYSNYIQAQTYYFKYQYGANDTYINTPKHNSIDNDFSSNFLSYYLKVYHNNTYIVGYQNDSLLHYKFDFSQLNQIFNDSVQFEVFGFIYKNEIPLDMRHFPDSNRIETISNKDYIVYIKNDIVKSKVHHIKEDLVETLEQRVINGWNCYKWVPSDISIQDKVEIWVSKDVPQQVNMGLFDKDLNGGVVEIYWNKGVYYRLQEFHEVPTYTFPTQLLYDKNIEVNPNSMSFMRKKTQSSINNNIKSHYKMNINGEVFDVD